MTILENDFLKAQISTKGAQLTSLFNKKTNTEQLWQADAAVWPWHFPNLFPVVGGLINNELLVDGKAYPMARHGFARQSEFKLLNSSEEHAAFSLPASAETLKAYPYEFDFQVLYTLIDNAIRVCYKLINLDNKTIYFSIGGHPAFNVPFHAGENYEDYYLEFELEEKLETHMLDKDGFFNGEVKPVSLDKNRLHLTREMFNNDALVLKNLKSRAITIKGAKHNESLSVEFPHFNYLGIWAKPGADFVCIEPWLGCADTAGIHADISQKEDIQQLEHGHVFESVFFISI